MTAQTATGICKRAYQDAGKLAAGGALSSVQLAEGIERLNDIINLRQTNGLRLWLETETPVPLVAGQQMYTFMPGGDVSVTRPLRIKQAAYWDSTSNVRPLTRCLSREEWTRLSSRTIQAAVSQFFYEKLYDRLNLYLWNIPDTTAATGTVKVVLQHQAGNVTLAADSPNFPIEWTLYLRWALAEDLATGMPQEIVARAERMAAKYLEDLNGWDVEGETETFFQPDMQTFARPGAFR